ncbi:hypothetical protein F511_07935 [Dorcoceras hygrometricum]|uniref:Retrotransposon gag domain-containing protein n=1 Tax=Dorcoceras hygrometricum TaxID=472368 RepID=A0A2Z7AE12_9LAMI|nr:hypothetical protein F511_07935 [Dorcoceras hygrometricum]
MPPRGRGRVRRQIPVKFGAQNVEDDVDQHSIPVHKRASQMEDEVDLLASWVDEMELVMARFQRTNPQAFMGANSSADAEAWLKHIVGLFNRVHYIDARRLSLATLKLRSDAQRWWRGIRPGVVFEQQGHEFDNLVQGDMRVAEYARQSYSILAYVPHVAGRERAKRNRFLEGLNEDLYSLVLESSPTTYAKAVDKALDSEQGLLNRRSRNRNEKIDIAPATAPPRVVAPHHLRHTHKHAGRLRAESKRRKSTSHRPRRRRVWWRLIILAARTSARDACALVAHGGRSCIAARRAMLRRVAFGERPLRRAPRPTHARRSAALVANAAATCASVAQRCAAGRAPLVVGRAARATRWLATMAHEVRRCFPADVR